MATLAGIVNGGTAQFLGALNGIVNLSGTAADSVVQGVKWGGKTVAAGIGKVPGGEKILSVATPILGHPLVLGGFVLFGANNIYERVKATNFNEVYGLKNVPAVSSFVENNKEWLAKGIFALSIFLFARAV